MRVGILILCFLVHGSSAIGGFHLPEPGTLDLHILSTVTIGQNAEASWTYSGVESASSTHTLVMVVTQTGAPAVTATTTALGSVNSGVISFNIPVTGSFQAVAALDSTAFASGIPFLPFIRASTVPLGYATADFFAVSKPPPPALSPPNGGPSVPDPSITGPPSSDTTSTPTTLSSQTITATLISTVTGGNPVSSNGATSGMSRTFLSTGTTISTTQMTTTSATGSSAITSNPTSGSGDIATSSHSLSTGALAGIIIGVIVALILLALLSYCLWQRRRMLRERAERAERARIDAIFYPGMKSVPPESAHIYDWRSDDDASSLAPSDSVSRLLHPPLRVQKTRPLAPSTALTAVGGGVDTLYKY
ncbi:hypothetical protein GYMLUDRAFT_100305 [Collybiopsis luxurians FD-317 M1]|uniref:Mid2 domain-containing protein n=1 Tax=Collybiopsis luxurians FD-317 M1 TaxID=944289 RepID=A0A0D0BW36_9AGAR|nr:hypothetical protein GYMLUDRAFT_100305 [Collybiopsis luxurians FD-317 M1]